MNRRKFLKISAASIALMGVGGILTLFRASDNLSQFYDATQKVFTAQFGDDLAVTLIAETKLAYEVLRSEIPYIGGEANRFTEWLGYGAYYLAMHQALSAHGHDVEETGRLIFRTYEVMADYPEWFLKIVGRFKYGPAYQEKLRRAAAVSQKRQYPGDFVLLFVEGDGENFDYGLDIEECGICKLYSAHGADQLTPFMCLSDFVISKAFDRGLVRFETIAEGGKKCDFRYKKGRKTFVYPLREGWPPRFLNADTAVS